MLLLWKKMLWVIDIPEDYPKAIYYDPMLCLLWGLKFHSYPQWFIPMWGSDREDHTQVSLSWKRGSVDKPDEFMGRTVFQDLPFLNPSYTNTVWSLSCFKWPFLSTLLFCPSFRGSFHHTQAIRGVKICPWGPITWMF